MTTYPAGTTRVVKILRGSILEAKDAKKKGIESAGKPTIILSWEKPHKDSARHHALEIQGPSRLLSTGDSTWLETEAEILAHDGAEFHGEEGHKSLRNIL